jgi:hypothetical protein
VQNRLVEEPVFTPGFSGGQADGSANSAPFSRCDRETGKIRFSIFRGQSPEIAAFFR